MTLNFGLNKEETLLPKLPTPIGSHQMSEHLQMEAFHLIENELVRLGLKHLWLCYMQLPRAGPALRCDQYDD